MVLASLAALVDLAGHPAPARWDCRTPARWTVVGSVLTTHLAPLPSGRAPLPLPPVVVAAVAPLLLLLLLSLPRVPVVAALPLPFSVSFAVFVVSELIWCII